jgi:hypothetical protein
MYPCQGTIKLGVISSHRMIGRFRPTASTTPLPSPPWRCCATSPSTDQPAPVHQKPPPPGCLELDISMICQAGRPWQPRPPVQFHGIRDAQRRHGRQVPPQHRGQLSPRQHCALSRHSSNVVPLGINRLQPLSVRCPPHPLLRHELVATTSECPRKHHCQPPASLPAIQCHDTSPWLGINLSGFEGFNGSSPSKPHHPQILAVSISSCLQPRTAASASHPANCT